MANTLSSRPILAMLLVASSIGCSADEPTYDEAWIAQSGWPVHTTCAQGTSTTFGIDVSKWQSSIDWPSVMNDGVVYAFVRVSDGTQYIDEQFEANWQGTKASGILRGPYQYFRPGQSATEQAELFVTRIEQAGGFEPGDLPPVIDVETTDGAATSDAIQGVQTWIDYVESHTGRRPIIYTGSYFWDDNSFGNSFSDYPLWTAHYTSAACPLVSDAWDHWTFWQYTSSGSVNGISGNVDENVFDGTLSDLQAFIANSLVGGEDAGADGPSVSDAQPDAVPDAQPDAVPDAEPDAHTDATPDAEPNEAGTDAGSDVAPDVIVADADPASTPKTGFYEGEEADGCACRQGARRHGLAGWWVLALAALALSRRVLRTV